MTRLRRRQQADELLDAPAHELAELESSLDHVAAVNRWLGGRRALLRRLPDVLGRGAAVPATTPLRVLDVGTGSADLPRAVARWARHRGFAVDLVATDLHPQILAVARRRCAAYPEIRLARADARSLPFADAAFDAALCSMTLHHLEFDAQVRALRELARVSRHGILVGELQRSLPALAGARLLAATLWRHNRLTRHDGPLSVRRAFTAQEFAALARHAGLTRVRVTVHPLFRLVLTAEPAR